MPLSMAKSKDDTRDIDEELHELDVGLAKLRIYYEQYFAGVLKREPYEPRAKVQRTVRSFTEKPVRRSGHKFRFNQLNAKFQSYRAHWGRILRQIEAGTYKPHQFRAKLHQKSVSGLESAEAKIKSSAAGDGKASWIDKITLDFEKARKKTGEGSSEGDRERIASMVKKQASALRKKYGDRKISFRVVVENDKAKLKASVKK